MPVKGSGADDGQDGDQLVKETEDGDQPVDEADDVLEDDQQLSGGWIQSVIFEVEWKEAAATHWTGQSRGYIDMMKVLEDIPDNLIIEV